MTTDSSTEMCVTTKQPDTESNLNHNHYAHTATYFQAAFAFRINRHRAIYTARAN